MVKSHGSRRRTRELFRKSTRTTVNQYLRQFPEGSKVAIVIESGSTNGFPFRRFQGKTGTIMGKRGKAFIVDFKDGDKLKTIITSAEHLKAL